MKFAKKDLKNEIKVPSPRRLYAVAEGLCGEFSVEEINIMTGIDKWFIRRCAVTSKKRNR
jgi:hypothetical protein